MVGEFAVTPDSVQISGPESVINKISKAAAEIDVSDFYKDVTKEAEVKLYDENSQEIDAGNLLISINNESNSLVSIKVTMLPTKSVKLSFKTTGTPAQGYVLKEVQHEPESVTIAGKQNILDQITVIEIPEEVFDISGAVKNIEKVIDITPYLGDGIQLANDSESGVLVKIIIDEAGSRTFEIPVGSIKVNNIQAGLTHSFVDTEDLEVVCRGDILILNELSLSDIEASIDLGAYKEAGTYDAEVKLSLPEGCYNIGTITVKVELVRSDNTTAKNS